MHPMQNTTKKLVSYHLSDNSYRSIELRHSFHQIDSIALTQASVLKSSDVNNQAVSVGSSVSDNCITFRSLQGLQSSSINPRMKKARICCRKRMRRSSFSELSAFCYRKIDVCFSDYFETLSVFSICARWRYATKVGKTLISSCSTLILKYPLFEAVPIIFPVSNEMCFQQNTRYSGEVQWLCSLALGLRRWMNR